MFTLFHTTGEGWPTSHQSGFELDMSKNSLSAAAGPVNSFIIHLPYREPVHTYTGLHFEALFTCLKFFEELDDVLLLCMLSVSF